MLIVWEEYVGLSLVALELEAVEKNRGTGSCDPSPDHCESELCCPIWSDH